MNALRQVTVLSEEVARATLQCASGYLQLKNTDALRRSERSLSPAGEEWGSPCGGLEERTCRLRPGCQRRAERPPCRGPDVYSKGPRSCPRLSGREGVAGATGGVRAASPARGTPLLFRPTTERAEPSSRPPPSPFLVTLPGAGPRGTPLPVTYQLGGARWT